MVFVRTVTTKHSSLCKTTLLPQKHSSYNTSMSTAEEYALRTVAEMTRSVEPTSVRSCLKPLRLVVPRCNNSPLVADNHRGLVVVRSDPTAFPKVYCTK